MNEKGKEEGKEEEEDIYAVFIYDDDAPAGLTWTDARPLVLTCDNVVQYGVHSTVLCGMTRQEGFVATYLPSLSCADVEALSRQTWSSL